MVAPPLARPLVKVSPRRPKDPLPTPFDRRPRKLPLKAARQLHSPFPPSLCPLMLGAYCLQMSGQRNYQDVRQHRPTISIALATAHGDLAAGDIEILHSQL